jgi:hypothetical protein
MSGSLTSRASVATESPERYAKQLLSHLGRRRDPVAEGDGHRLMFDVGSCLVTPEPDTLVLVATADNQEALATVKDVVGRHLERFGQRNELVVTWTDGA